MSNTTFNRGMLPPIPLREAMGEPIEDFGEESAELSAAPPPEGVAVVTDRLEGILFGVETEGSESLLLSKSLSVKSDAESPQGGEIPPCDGVGGEATEEF
jgi:hypothetical protein